MRIVFPNKTAKEIVDECNNTLNGHKLLWNIDWYKNEDFYTKEKCREGSREIITDMSDTLGKTWNECDKMGDMLTFAELLWCVIQIPDFLKNNYSWTSSRTSDGGFVDAGDFDDVGGDVGRWRPRVSASFIGCAFSRDDGGPVRRWLPLNSDSDFGCTFSRSDTSTLSPIDTLNGDKASSLEARVKDLEDWRDGIIECVNKK